MLWVRSDGDHEGIPNEVLTKGLLNERMKHISEEAHGRPARDGAIMVAVHVELMIDEMAEVGLVEMVEDVWKDDGAVDMPFVMDFSSREATKEEVWVNCKGQGGLRRMTINYEIIGVHMWGKGAFKPI